MRAITPTVLCFIGCVLFACSLSSCGHAEIRPETNVLIPQGYVGWVRIEYGVAGAPPLERYYRLPPPMLRQQEIIPPSGLLQTSTRFGQGTLKNTYFYSGDTVNPIPKSSITCFVTHHSVRFADQAYQREFVTFFVAGDNAKADACAALEKFKSASGSSHFSMKTFADLPMPGNINAKVAH